MRGASARGRRTQRRAAERRVTGGVSKALGQASFGNDISRVEFLKATGIVPSRAQIEDIALAEVGQGDASLYARRVREITAMFAVGDLLWDAEDGVTDLMCDISEALNPGDSWRWWVVDVATSLDKAVLCDGGYEYWLAPFTIGADKEPTLSPMSEWTSLESAWVEGDERYSKAIATVKEQGFGSEYAAASGTCANCGHPADMHADITAGDNMGACAASGCSCGAMEAASIEPAGLNADGSVVLLPEHQPGEVLPAVHPSPRAPEGTMTGGPVEWNAVLCPEGQLTDDGRAFAPGSITWRELPLTLMAMIETSEGGHIGAELCGRIDKIWRDETAGLIRASGIFDTGDYGQEIARLVDDRTLRGVSVDLAIHSYEYGPKSDWFDDEGNWAPKAAASEQSEPDLLDILFNQEEDSVAVVTSAVIGMTTVCPFPAFADAEITVGQSLVAGANPGIWTITMQAAFSLVAVKPVESLVASSPGAVLRRYGAALFPEDQSLTAAGEGLAPVEPPSEWFANPELEEVTGITVTDDGRVFGHAAAWGTCHTAFVDVCVSPPHSDHDYAYFHLGEVVCADGARVACGQITLDTGHAANDMGRVDATRHYDDTGAAVADIVVGEDEFGIWVSGAIRPGLSSEVLRELRGSKLSGDWRGVNGNLELIALLAVNVPGFPVPRARALVADGQTVSLVASGILILEEDFTDEDRERFAELTALAARAAA